MINEKEDLERNHIYPNTMAHLLYNEFRKTGLSHKDAIIKVVDSINNLQAKDLDDNLLQVLKEAFFHVQGKID